MNDYSERTRFERYRLMVISTWPDSALKAAALVSARAALERERAVLPSRVTGEPFIRRPLAA